MNNKKIKYEFKLYRFCILSVIAFFLIAPSLFFYIDFNGQLVFHFFMFNKIFGDPGLFTWFFTNLLCLVINNNVVVYKQILIISFFLKATLILLLFIMFIVCFARKLKSKKNLWKNDLKIDSNNRKIYGSFAIVFMPFLIAVIPIIWSLIFGTFTLTFLVWDFSAININKKIYNSELVQIRETKKNEEVKKINDPKLLSKYAKAKNQDLDKYNNISNYLTMQQFNSKIKEFAAALPLKLLTPKKHSVCRIKFIQKMDNENIKISKVQLAILDYLLLKVTRKEIFKFSPEKADGKDEDFERRKKKFQKKYLDDNYYVQISQQELTGKFNDIDLSKTINGIENSADNVDLKIYDDKPEKSSKKKTKSKKNSDTLFDL
ncbi:hypothetical protein [Spiroplasma endosymbiont of Amphibalanus improvisus]|uniref:hypothetical protein n=1 Tax=Spiroplasma endosymbiont of Amphibalanus improvisus TaxID=3066327 RepID=UPI00313CBFA0